MKLKNTLKKNSVKHYVILLLGAAILSFGLFNIHSQSKVTEGGVLGMTLLINHWFGVTPGVSGIIMDSICYLIGFRILGKTFLKNALVASFGFSIFYNLYDRIGFVVPDLSAYPLAAAIVGGIFVGIGVGLVVREGGASGGDDALAMILSKALKCKISRAYFATDFIVLLLSVSYIPIKNILFSLVTVTLSSYIIGKLQKDICSASPAVVS